MQNDERFKDDPSVKKLSFTRPWTRSFLERNAFCKRKATATTKKMPPLEEIHAIMAGIQKTIEEKNFTPAQCFSSDETGMFYAAPPRNQFVPKDAARGSTPEGDKKARFAALESGNGDGGMLPSMHVIKCTFKKGASDFSQTQVVHNLHREHGFT